MLKRKFAEKNKDTNNNNNAKKIQDDSTPLIKKTDFTAKDYEFLAENENGRYLPNGKQVGHAVISKIDGKKIALQFNIPQVQNGKAPKVTQLSNIQEIHPFGLTRYKAEAEDGTEMFAKRFSRAILTNKNHETEIDIAYFSPVEGKRKEPFWGTEDKEVPLFRNQLSKEEQEEFDEDLNQFEPVVKGGHELKVDPKSVEARELNKTRKPDQNTVMGESAQKAYENFLNQMADELSDEIKEAMRRAIDAPLRDAFKGNYRPEWLHAEGFSLTPVDKDPQRENNLGAAPKWANTEMMILERIAKWFAQNHPDIYTIKIKPTFQMLLDSEIIKKINFELTLEDQNKQIKFLQEINPFKKYPLFRKASDLAQGTMITEALLKDRSFTSMQEIKEVEKDKPLSTGLNFSSLFSQNAQALAQKFSDSPTAQGKKHNEKHKFPTHLKYEKSIVQIEANSFEPDYDTPWKGSDIFSSSGTGLVIEYKGKKYIFTNYHCVKNALIIRVRLANSRKKFEAQLKCVSPQCDLALLEVTDPEFNETAEAVTLGDMVAIKDKVETVGFPMGGNEISVSKGIASRIEVRDYCMSGLDMLQVQIDAAVNPGNSGGPVFSNDKVVGVAFQGYDRQGLGYMIPIPIIKHFLHEALNNKIYRGFPILPISVHTLENPTQRKYYGMKENQTGVRIGKVDFLCDAHDKLKPDDIILEMEGLLVSNDGKVEIPGIGNGIDMIHLQHMKYIGESIKLKILRKNENTNQLETIEVSVILDNVPLETKKVPQTEFDKTPTYYIASGIAFVPLTYNYLEGKGSDLEDYVITEENCSIRSASKNKPNEQFIVINDILDCEETESYEKYVNKIVKEINGKMIDNMQDVIDAMENNKSDTHIIKTRGDSVIAVKNMSKEEHRALLTKYKIDRDRSKDLKKQDLDEDLSDSEENVESISLGSQDSETEDESAEIPLKIKSKSKKMKEEMEVDEKLPLTRQNLPSAKRFMATISALENRYKDTNNDDDESSEDEDFIVDSPLPEKEKGKRKEIDEISSGQESESEEEYRSTTRKKTSNKHHFFQSKQAEKSTFQHRNVNERLNSARKRRYQH